MITLLELEALKLNLGGLAVLSSKPREMKNWVLREDPTGLDQDITDLGYRALILKPKSESEPKPSLNLNLHQALARDPPSFNKLPALTRVPASFDKGTSLVLLLSKLRLRLGFRFRFRWKLQSKFQPKPKT